jgi:hypothetical protein
MFIAGETRSAAEAGARWAAVNGYNSTSMVSAVQSGTAITINSGNISTSTFYACVTGSGATAAIGSTQSASFLCADGKTTSGQFATVNISPTFAAIFPGDGAKAPSVTATIRIL